MLGQLFSFAFVILSINSGQRLEEKEECYFYPLKANVLGVSEEKFRSSNLEVVLNLNGFGASTRGAILEPPCSLV